jgi:hypothetical protein
MLKAVGYAILPLILGLVLASTAVAVPPGKKGSKERRDHCVDLLLVCVVGCTIFDSNDEFVDCNNDCNNEYGICMDAKTGGPAEDVTDIDQSPGVLSEPDLHNVHVVPIGPIGATQVEQACKRVGGEFGRFDNAFGCINRLCDDKGNCVITCYGGNCLAITPDQLPDQVTLLGILQNGDNVDRRPPALSPDSPDDDGGCTGKGCDIIF